MDNETHSFKVSVWLPGKDNPKSLFDRGYWSEMARCTGKTSANEVAECLSIRWPKGVQIAEFVNDSFVGYKFIPESAKELK